MKVHKRLGEILVEAGKITRDQLRQALASPSTPGAKIGEKLLALNFIDEVTLFNILSKQLKIPIIPQEKFESIKVSQHALELIPIHFATKNLVFPIQLDGERHSVSVAMIDPTDQETIKEIGILCQMQKVKCYLAQRSSILWAINKYYGGEGAAAAVKTPASEAKQKTLTLTPTLKDDTASGILKKTTSVSMATSLPRETTEHTSVNPLAAAEMIAQELLIDDSTAITSGKATPKNTASASTASKQKASDSDSRMGVEDFTISVNVPEPGSESSGSYHLTPANLPETTSRKAIGRVEPKKIPLSELTGSYSAPVIIDKPVTDIHPGAKDTQSPKRWAATQRVLLVMPDKVDASSLEGILASDGYQTTICHKIDEAKNYLSRNAFDIVLLKSSFSHEQEEILELARRRHPATQIRLYSSLSSSIIGDPVAYEDLRKTYFHTMDFLISLLERQSPGQRHFAHVIAKYSRLVSQRLSLAIREQDEIYLASFLHDIWKYLKDQDIEKTDEAEERRHILEVFSDINCPYQIVPIIRSISEFYNGTGKPLGLKGEDIPVGSRIISVVRAYDEMIQTKLIKDLSEIGKVSKFLRKAAGKKFDPNCVEAFVHVLEGESFLKSGGVQPILEPTEDILIVDKDAQSTSLIELRLINEGFSVRVLRDGQQALRTVETQPPTLIISDVVLPKIDGFNLCESIKKNPKTKHIPFIFVSSRNDEFNMTKGLELGADDYQTKPVNVPFLITKVRKLLEQSSGVSLSPRSGSAGGTPEGVSGNLSQMGLVEIIQILGGGSKTAFLSIKSAEGNKAEVYLERGRIVAAQSNGINGEEAFYEIMTWREGSFSLIAERTTDSKNINNSTDFLLLEAMRRMDEANAKIQMA